MPAVPFAESQEDLAGRVFNAPKKYLTQLLKGMTRGAVALPGDAADVAGMALGQQTGAGSAIRAMLDKTEALKGEGTSMENIGEVFAPNPGGPALKAAAGAGILVDAMRASRAGLLPMQAVEDAIKAFRRGTNPREIYAATKVDVSQPSILSPKEQALYAVETPGYSSGGLPSGPLDKQSLSQRINSGEFRGLDELLKVYPELGKMQTTKTDALDELTFGAFNPRQNSLMLNYALWKNRGEPVFRQMGGDRTLGHELRHAAAGIDDAPPGANPSQGSNLVNRLGPHLQRGNQNLEVAALARQLLEDTGRANTSVNGPASMMDLGNVLRSNPRTFRDAPPMNQRAATLATRVPSETLRSMLDLNESLIQRLPNNPGDAYLKAWDEVKARQSEQMLGKPRSFLDANAPGDLPYDSPVPLKQQFDMRDYDARLLRKLGLI